MRRTKLESNGNSNAMTYREPLPEDCPPEDADEITAPRVVYRLVRNNPPADDDFRSQRAEKPAAQFNVSECRARGVSVFASRRDVEIRARRGNLEGLAICQVTLVEGAGRIKKTGARSHHTWWPYSGYDILANCQMVHL